MDLALPYGPIATTNTVLQRINARLPIGAWTQLSSAVWSALEHSYQLNLPYGRKVAYQGQDGTVVCSLPTRDGNSLWLITAKSNSTPDLSIFPLGMISQHDAIPTLERMLEPPLDTQPRLIEALTAFLLTYHPNAKGLWGMGQGPWGAVLFERLGEKTVPANPIQAKAKAVFGVTSSGWWPTLVAQRTPFPLPKGQDAPSIVLKPQPIVWFSPDTLSAHARILLHHTPPSWEIPFFNRVRAVKSADSSAQPTG